MTGLKSGFAPAVKEFRKEINHVLKNAHQADEVDERGEKRGQNQFIVGK